MTGVTVVIATAGSNRIHDMVASLAAQQDAPDFDVLIADNTGGLDPRDILGLANTCGLDTQIVPATRRPGKAHAVNTAVAATTSDVILILDDDDTVPGNYVAVMAAAVRAHAYVGARLDLAALNTPAARDRRVPLQYDTLPTFGGVPFVVGAATGINRDLLVDLDGFDEDLLTQDDVDLGIRVDAHRHDVAPVLVTGTWVDYRYRDTPAGVFRQERAYGVGASALWAKHRTYLGSRPARETASILAAAARSLTVRGEAGRMARATRWGALVGRVEGGLRHWA